LSPREAIGVDLGGTKMAVGVVDSEQHVHFEGNESSIGLTEDQLVVDLGRELEEAKAARPDVLCAGLGIPATIDHDRGVAIQAVNLVRVVALYLTGANFPSLFDASHTVVWQTIVILFSVLLWILWANRLGAPREPTSQLPA